MLRFVKANDILHTSKCSRIKQKPITEEYANLSDISELVNTKICKCCRQEVQEYLAYKAIEDMRNAFYNWIKTYAKGYDYTVMELDTGDVEIATTLEKWVVHINDIRENDFAKITLYHKNNLLFKSKGKCNHFYPEYHIQFVKQMMAYDIVKYVNKHEVEKWGAKVKAPVFETLQENILSKARQ